MSAIPKKTTKDRSTEFRGFLKDVKGWDSEPKEQSHKLKSTTQDGKKGSLHGAGKVIEGKGPTTRGPATEVNRKPIALSSLSSQGHGYQYNNLSYVDAANKICNNFDDDEERPPDAVSEKELGNDYFKQKKFQEAIDCYSRSIAFTPTAVAYANRAMAYLKVGRYEDAEKDCSEALDLDDHYVKAYSRRATARKELQKFKASMDDCEFAVSLDPNNPELRKQYSDTKAVYEKEYAQKIHRAPQISMKGISGSPEMGEKIHLGLGSDLNCNQVATMPIQFSNTKREAARQKLEASIDLAARASSLAAAAASKNITVPKNAYQFEVSWRALSDDHGMQAQLLKTIPPTEYPQIFKNALTASIVADIIRCTSLFFKEETELAVSILHNLTMVPRFDLIAMCFSPADRSDLGRIWAKVFSSSDVPAEQLAAISELRPRYLPVEMLT